MKVFTVEDDPTLKNIITVFLNKFSKEHQVELDLHAYMDATEGLFELMQHASSYDVLILDVRMPGVSGIDIYKTMKQMHADVCQKVLFITGNRYDLLSFFPKDSLNILNKPFSYQQFEKEIHHIRTIS